MKEKHKRGISRMSARYASSGGGVTLRCCADRMARAHAKLVECSLGNKISC